MNDIDYSIYLVTGRELLPPGKDYYESLEESLQGGVTLVQIREKNIDTGEFIEIATKSKEICDRYNVPVIINDRVDVAVAVKARGVHLGQTDMSVPQARKLLPEGTVIGVSCNNAHHVRAAIEDGADSIGIGAVWGTQTKQLTSPLVGVRGVGTLLELLGGTNIKAVAIGGIKIKNLLRTLHGSVSRTGRALDGVAIVSEIMASGDPRQAAITLSTIFNSFTITTNLPPVMSPQGLSAGQIIVEKITNTVVATQSANITLSLGGSPIMASEPQEMEDLGHISSALLINIGTMRSDGKESMSKAGYFANINKKPVIFDPVGIGASAFRRDTARDLLNVFQASVIKGNAGELAALAGTQEVFTKGVDSVGSGFRDPVGFVRDLARKERCVIALTGPVDYISDGTNVVALSNGHEILAKITGSGCIVGSSIATYCGALFARSTGDSTGKLVQGDTFLGAIAGIMVLTVAAEAAVLREDVKGPGTFLPALIDELWALQPRAVQSLARIEVF
ncbi:putative thiamine biosynthetic bifunctional enzyme [Termitomyces sp. J132]|nr:putative thiamine biosynthetic bifunctional enzyme [Termitomyces sp. J132]